MVNIRTLGSIASSTFALAKYMQKKIGRCERKHNQTCEQYHVAKIKSKFKDPVLIKQSFGYPRYDDCG